MSGWNAGRGVLLPQTAPRSHCEPRLVLTCVRVSRTVVERARISAVLTACARRALPAVRAAPAWRLVCYLCAVGASVIWLQRFFSRFFQSAGRSFIVVGLPGRVEATRARGWGNRGKSTMSVRDVSSIVRGRQGPRAENHGRSAARRGMPRSARRRRAARARNAHELTQTAEYSAPRTAAIRGTARASGSERNGTCTWTISGRSRTR